MSGKDGNGKCSHEPNVYSDWQVNGNSLANASIGMMQIGNSVGESSSCSSVAMVDSFGLPIWDQNHNLGYGDVENGASNSGGTGLVRTDMNWVSNAMFRGSMFPVMVPQSLPHFPVDSGFIEGAARFSCFSGGNFGEMMNPVGVLDPLAMCSRGHFGMMQETRDVVGGNESKAQSIGRSQNIEMMMDEVNKEALLLWKPVQGESSYMNEKKSGSFMEAKNGAGMSNNESDKAECSGRGAQEEAKGLNGESSSKGLESMKRKRDRQDDEPDENTDTPQPSVDTLEDVAGIKVDQNATSIGKAGGKQPSQSSDMPKEEYIHVRARRGQATNTHSLAERVRREKISERMKFLQDLVPGCSKVTGKAVMLDEIINYVQSLQRQVEFLSMKLATVNSGLDFNIEACLSKEPRAGPVAFLPNMTMPFSPLHPSQPGLVQAGFVGNSAEALSRSANIQTATACRGYKDLISQVHGEWDNELHSVIHMGLSSSAPVNSQDFIGSLRPGHLKTEP